jgi:hypothetical protein
MNLVPATGYHFCASNSVPIIINHSDLHLKTDEKELVEGVFDLKNLSSDVISRNEQYYCGNLIVRGQVREDEVNSEFQKMMKNRRIRSAEWIPDGVWQSFVEVGGRGRENSATFVSNSDYVRGVFARIEEKFEDFYGEGLNIEKYVEYGVEDEEIRGRCENLIRLCDKYSTAEFTFDDALDQSLGFRD